MTDGYAILIGLYVLGVALLAAELFIPSGGLLTVASIVVFIIAVVKTFAYGTTAGVAAAVVCTVMLPTVLLLVIKNIHRMPMGKYVAPPNPARTLK